MTIRFFKIGYSNKILPVNSARMSPGAQAGVYMGAMAPFRIVVKKAELPEGISPLPARQPHVHALTLYVGSINVHESTAHTT